MALLHQFWKLAAPEELICLNISIVYRVAITLIFVSASQSHDAELVMQQPLPEQ